MQTKMIKVHLKDGKICTDLFETPSQAIKKYGITNIAKLEEVNDKKLIVTKPRDSQIILEVSKRTEEDLKLSKECGYTLAYTKPSMDKIYSGMVFVESSDKHVLVSEFQRLEKFDKLVHHHWKNIGYKPAKTWKVALYHKNAKLITKEEAEKQYGKLTNTIGGIGYINRAKETAK